MIPQSICLLSSQPALGIEGGNPYSEITRYRSRFSEHTLSLCEQPPRCALGKISILEP